MQRAETAWHYAPRVQLTLTPTPPHVRRRLEQRGERVMGNVDLDVIENQLAQVYTRALEPAAQEHIHAALLELDVEVPTGLAECPSCGRVGLPGRVRDHDC